MREKNKFYIKFIFILICILLIGGLYIQILINQRKMEIENYLYEISKKEANIIHNKIENDINVLKIIQKTFNDGNNENEIINKYKTNFEEIKIEINNEKKYLINNLNINIEKINIENNEYYNKALNGEENISKEIEINNNYYYLYNIPIYNNNKIIGVISGINNSKEIKNILNTNIFNGEGYSHIISNNGQILVNADHKNSDANTNNIFDIKFKNIKEKNNTKNNLLNNKSGNTKIISNENKTLVYVPIEKNNFFIASFIPERIINFEFNKIIFLTILLIISILIIILLFIFNIKKYKEKNKKIIYELAYKDELTGGYNKNKFYIEAINKIKNNKNNYSILILNIKNFKNINYLFGRNKGDKILINIFKTIEKIINKKELIGRERDDIFYLLLENEKLNLKIEQIINEIKENCKKELINYNINLNIGIYKIKKNEINKIEEIKNILDKIKYLLKSEEEINYYNSKIEEKIIHKNQIEKEMENALINNEFKIYIQPRYDTMSEKIIGGEALIRWIKDGKIIMPDEFIPIFEENNFIKKIDLYVLNKICEKENEWKNKKIKISINQSQKNLYDENYINNIKKILSKNKINNKLIEIELTETVFIKNIEKIKKLENELHKLELKIAMDDFGTGYSSYKLLEQINIDVLKLDKSFFKDFSETKTKIIIKQIINMAHELNIITVAEGIETKEQVEFLKQVKCNEIQGYYFSKPIPIEEFEKLIQEN